MKVRLFSVLFIAIALLLAGCSGGTDQIGFNAPRQITRALAGHFDHYPILSPDGTKVLFQRDVKSGSTGLYRYELWVINTDGSDERRLVSAADLPGQMGYVMGEEEETMLDRLPQQVAWLEDSRRIALIL